jgi:hypothetical protein
VLFSEAPQMLPPQAFSGPHKALILFFEKAPISLPSRFWSTRLKRYQVSALPVPITCAITMFQIRDITSFCHSLTYRFGNTELCLGKSDRLAQLEVA